MPSTFPTQSQPRRLGDLLIAEFHPSYNRASAYVYNGSGSAVDILDSLGYPVKSDGSGGYALAFSGDEGSVLGLILFQHEIKLAGTTRATFLVPILVRGPAIIDYSGGIPLLDAAGGSFNITTINTTLKALSAPILPFAEPSISVTQTS